MKKNDTDIIAWIWKERTGLLCILAFIGVGYLFVDFTVGTWLEGKFLEFISVGGVLIFISIKLRAP